MPHGQVSKFGSIPAQFLYNWVFVCVSMVEHSRKMKDAAATDPEEGESDGTATKLTEVVDGDGETGEHQAEEGKPQVCAGGFW